MGVHRTRRRVNDIPRICRHSPIVARIFAGWCGLPGFPRPVKVTLLAANKLPAPPVAEPSRALVDLVHRQYMTHLHAGFERHKASKQRPAPSILHVWRSTRFRLLICAYDAPPWGVRVDKLTK